MPARRTGRIFPIRPHCDKDSKSAAGRWVCLWLFVAAFSVPRITPCLVHRSRAYQHSRLRFFTKMRYFKANLGWLAIAVMLTIVGRSRASASATVSSEKGQQEPAYKKYHTCGDLDAGGDGSVTLMPGMATFLHPISCDPPIVRICMRRARPLVPAVPPAPVSSVPCTYLLYVCRIIF